MKLKKVLAVCLATAMTFSMVACGGAGTDTTPADTSADTETEAPAEEETEAPAEEEAEAPAEDGALMYTYLFFNQVRRGLHRHYNNDQVYSLQNRP